MASDPVYQYWARRYKLNLRSVHWEPDEAPTDEMWKEFQALMESHPAKWMIWEGPPLEETVKRLQALGVGSVVFCPCSNVPDKRRTQDYLTAVAKNVSLLRVRSVFPP